MGVNVRIDKVILHMLSLHTTSSQGKHKAIVFIKLLRESPLQGQPQPLGRLRVREADDVLQLLGLGYLAIVHVALEFGRIMSPRARACSQRRARRPRGGPHTPDW